MKFEMAEYDVLSITDNCKMLNICYIKISLFNKNGIFAQISINFSRYSMAPDKKKIWCTFVSIFLNFLYIVASIRIASLRQLQ